MEAKSTTIPETPVEATTICPLCGKKHSYFCGKTKTWSCMNCRDDVFTCQVCEEPGCKDCGNLCNNNEHYYGEPYCDEENMCRNGRHSKCGGEFKKCRFCKGILCDDCLPEDDRCDKCYRTEYATVFY